MDSTGVFEVIGREPRLSDKVAATIRDTILSGRLRSGDLLPSERELAQRYEVSGPTVREAIRGLTLLGLADVRHGSGAFVTADLNHGGTLIANRTAIGTWETFTLLHIGNGRVGLGALANKMIVTAEAAGAQPLIANRTQIGTWETFFFIV